MSEEIADTLSLKEDAKDAVADAVMVAFAQCLKCQATSPEVAREIKERPMEETVQTLTAEACKANSLRAIIFLQQKYSHLFKQLFLLQGYRTQTETFKTLETGKQYRRHFYAVARGLDDQYYVVSPANYRIGRDESYQPLTDILESRSLEEIMQRIKERDGGSWPTGKQVEEGLKKYSSPQVISRPGEKLIQVFLVGNMPEPGDIKTTFWSGPISETIPWIEDTNLPK